MSEKKKPEDYALFTMRMSKKDNKRFSDFGKKYNLSLAQLVREGLRILEGNPNHLDHTVNPYLLAIKDAQLGAHQERIEYNEHLEERIIRVEQSVGNIERILEKFVTKGKPLTKKELKEAQHKDLSSEAVFED